MLVLNANGFQIASLAPIPEPDRVEILLAGIGQIGVVLRRRHKVRRA